MMLFLSSMDYKLCKDRIIMDQMVNGSPPSDFAYNGL
jgi:hypothetical protein